MDYKLRDEELLEEIKLSATLAFVGGHGRRYAQNFVLYDCAPDISAQKVYLGTSDNIQSIYSEAVDEVPCGAYPWNDYRNWVPVVDGVVQEDAPDEDRRVPDGTDIVLILAPVSVGGNKRIAKGQGYGAGEFGGNAGDLVEYKFYSLFTPNMTDAINGFITNEQVSESSAFNSTRAADMGQHLFGGDVWSGTIYGPMAVGQWQPPTCHYAYFLDGSYICPDELNVELAVLKAESLNLNISFPCAFFGNSYINCQTATLRYRNYFNSTGSFNFVTRIGIGVRLVFTGHISFFGRSGIQKTSSAVHPDYFVGYRNEFNVDSYPAYLFDRPDATKYYEEVAKASLKGYVGGIALRGAVTFFGDNKVQMVAAPECIVNFTEESEFNGGCVSQARFFEKAVCSVYQQPQLEKAVFFSRGARVTQLAIFRDQSSCRWPLACQVLFQGSSSCQIPCVGDVKFEEKSIYVWKYFMMPITFFFAGLRGIHTGTKTIKLPETSATVFDGDSMCIDSKVITPAPTQFLNKGKIIIQKRFHNANGYLPANFTGNYEDSGKLTDLTNVAGNGLGHVNPFIEKDSDKLHCEHVHFKVGPSVLISGAENRINVVSCAPLIYAEFHELEDSDWNNPNNWIRIGGTNDMVPLPNTIVRIKSQTRVIHNSGPIAMCAALIMESNCLVKIDFDEMSAMFNSGIFEGKINGVGDLFMTGNGINMGKIKQATMTYFADQAKNFGEGADGVVDGFIRTGGLLVMRPRTLAQPIYGDLEAPKPSLTDWSNVSSNLFGASPMTPEQYAYNVSHNCVGDYVNQTN